MTRMTRMVAGAALSRVLYGALATTTPAVPQSVPVDWPVREATPRSIGPRTIAAEDFAGCQPDTFDGRTTGTLPHLCEYSALRGHDADGANIDLRAPFELTLHRFRDSIETTYAIEITRGGKRHALFTHVDDFDADPDGRTLTITGWVKTGAGWQSQASVVDVPSGKVTALPAQNCTRHAGPVGPHGALTYGDEAIACLWTSAGRLEIAFTIPRMERSAEGRLPRTSLARLQGGGLGVVLPSRSEAQVCDVLLTGPAGRTARRVPLNLSRFQIARELDQRLCAGALEIDWAGVRPGGGNVRYRVSLTSWQPGRRVWSSWMTAGNDATGQ
jgi:hypothetical protein